MITLIQRSYNSRHGSSNSWAIGEVYRKCKGRRNRISWGDYSYWAVGNFFLMPLGSEINDEWGWCQQPGQWSSLFVLNQDSATTVLLCWFTHLLEASWGSMSFRKPLDSEAWFLLLRQWKLNCWNYCMLADSSAKWASAARVKLTWRVPCE